LKENIMRKKIFNITLIFLLIINTSAVLTMVYNKWLRIQPSDFETEPAVPLLQNELELSEAQAENLEKSRLSFENELENVNDLLTEKRIILLDYIRSSESDTYSTNKLIDEIATIQAEIQKKVVRQLIQEKNSLTPEQQQKYFSVFENRFRKGLMQGQGQGKGRRWMEQGRRGRGLGRQRNRDRN